jgi:hypothetical protein
MQRLELHPDLRHVRDVRRRVLEQRKPLQRQSANH